MRPDEIDVEKLRAAFHRESRGNLLLIADRAIDLVPRERLGELVRDIIRLEVRSPDSRDSRTLPAKVRRFHAAALRREYHESFDVDSKNCTQKSRGTDAFIADFHRLLDECVRQAEQARRAGVRQAFELLFDLLCRIDDDPDQILFFADEGGSWQVGVNWRTALPAYFRCLAEEASPEEFAREVARTIGEFADHDRPHLLAAARRVGNPAQKTALSGLSRK